MKNIEEFWYLFVQSNVDGIWVSETFFLPDFSDLSIACDDYVVYRADRFSHAGGVAIYVNKKLNSVLREISVDYTDVIITGDLKSNILRDKHLLDSFEYIGLFSLTTTRDTLLGLSFVDVPNKILLYDQVSVSVFSRHHLIFLTYDLTLAYNSNTFEFRDYKTRKNVIVECLDYQIPVTHLMGPKGTFIFRLGIK